MASWPEAWQELVRELGSSRRQPALVESSPESSELLAELRNRVAEVVSVGRTVADSDSAEALLRRIEPQAPSTLLTELEVLFAPQMNLDVVALLRRMAQHSALVVAWPGQIANGRLSYSRPGRVDHLDEPARGLIVLRPAAADFPDEVPYTVERYPA